MTTAFKRLRYRYAHCPESRYTAEFDNSCRTLEQTIGGIRHFITTVQAHLEIFQSPNGGATRLEEIGEDTNTLSHTFMATMPYHRALLLTSLAEKQIGLLEKMYVQKVNDEVIAPCNGWLKNRATQYTKQRELLTKLKMDMDFAVYKLKQKHGKGAWKSAKEKAAKKHDDQMEIVSRTVQTFEDEDLPIHENMMVHLLQLNRQYFQQAVDGLFACLGDLKN